MGGIRLGGYPAKRCPRAVHNTFAPGTPSPEPVSAETQRLFDGGLDFEAEVTDVLRTALGDRATILAQADPPAWDQLVEDTVAAMGRGDEVIVNGRLPAVGQRLGAPDVLVRVGPADAPTYLPVDIKHHHTTASATRNAVLSYSALDSPADRRIDPDRSSRGGHRRDDTMQLAHYTRMLQDLGYHPGEEHLIGGIIGTDPYDDLTSYSHGITWYDLSEATERTYSASADGHRKDRSALERYDHEFAFRLDVADAASRGEELVRPIGTDECFTCVWADYCAEIAGPEDASFALTHGRLRMREWNALAARGVRTIDELASLPITSELLEDFATNAPSRRGQAGAETALRAAVERARMIRDDIAIEPLGRWPVVPTADIEVDFDIEWGTDQRIYQWGLRIRDGQDERSARYEPVISFEPLDAAAEEALAEALADRLEALIANADRRGLSLTVFHWSHPETSMTRRFDRVAQLLEGRTFDLCAWMKANFRVRESFSIKNVAPIFGFEWGVEDAGGFSSMEKIALARTSGPDSDAARAWCLEYNEADVAAQAAIRDALWRLRVA